MAFYRGCTASISFGTVFLPMTEWKLNVDGERIDVSDYDQQTFKSIVGMRTATISLSGPYPSSIVGYGYGLATGDDLLVKLYLDPEFYYFFQVMARIEKMSVTTNVKGVVECTIDLVVIGDFKLGDDTNTEAIAI